MLTHHRELTERVIGAAIAVHRALGPGLLESAYEHCLLLELEAREMAVRRQVPVDLAYRGQVVAGAYRIDLLVEEAVVVEVKAVERMLPLHASQVLTYVRLAGHKVGLLLNFNVDRLADGMKRVVAD